MVKNIVISVLVILTSIMALNYVFGWFYLSKEEKIVKEFIKSKPDTIKIEKWINKIDSTTHIKYVPIKSQILQNNISKNTSEYVKDTLVPALKIASEQITEYKRITAKLEGELKIAKIERDNMNNQRVFYKNKYLSIVTQDSTLNYSYNATLDIVNYPKKGGFFKGSKEYIDISSPDKNFKVNGAENFIKEIYIKPKRFGIGFNGGYVFVPELGKFYPAFGVGLSYNFITF